MKKLLKILCVAGVLLFASKSAVYADEAVTLTPEIVTSNGASVDSMTDGSYYSSSTFNAGDTITLTSTESISSLYIVWNNETVGEWTLTYSGETQDCGENGFLHEYVKVSAPAKSVTINIEADGMNICKIFAFGEGEVPSWVQTWDEPCDTADMLLISTHADDEILFFGGILPYYAGELDLRVQVAYFCQFWDSAAVREHEKLDGLWTCGVKYYPINGGFDDIYCTDLESAKTVYDYDDSVAYITELIRRFKPLVLVGQDLNGEYGHGGHMLTAAAICDAVEISNDATSYPESADTYGCYDVPKTYLHLYAENTIDLDCQRALTAFDGKTVLEVASEAYLKHESQQWCWFYVSDTYQYSCGRYGLYRTLVGNDTSSDLLCNLTTYEERESIAAAEAESMSQVESIMASLAERESISAHEAEMASIEAASKAVDISKPQTRNMIIAIVAFAVAFVALIIFLAVKRKKK